GKDVVGRDLGADGAAVGTVPRLEVAPLHPRDGLARGVRGGGDGEGVEPPVPEVLGDAAEGPHAELSAEELSERLGVEEPAFAAGSPRADGEEAVAPAEDGPHRAGPNLVEDMPGAESAPECAQPVSLGGERLGV